MRVANWAMGSSAFAIHAISFFAPERRSQMARGLREDSDGRTRRRRPATLLRPADRRARHLLCCRRASSTKRPEFSEFTGRLAGRRRSGRVGTSVLRRRLDEPHHCGVRSEAVERESIAMRSSARRVSISSGVIGNGGQAWITKQRATPRDHDRSPDSRAARSPSTPVLDLARTHGDPKAAAPPEVTRRALPACPARHREVG